MYHAALQELILHAEASRLERQAARAEQIRIAMSGNGTRPRKRLPWWKRFWPTGHSSDPTWPTATA